MSKQSQIIKTAAVLLATSLSLPAQTLTHRYSFNEPMFSPSFSDSVGGVPWEGTLLGGAFLNGSQLQLDGFGSWATVPADILGSSTQVTIEFWADLSANNPVWTRVFAFGEQDGSGGQMAGLDYCHYAGGNWQNLNLSTSTGGVYVNNPGGLNGRTNVHVTIIVDPVGNQMYYYNDTVVASNPGINGNGGIVPPLSGLNDTLNLIGKSLWDVDATLEGAINEFRVYQGVLPASRVAINHAAGPDNYVTDPGTLQSVQLTSPVNPLNVGQNSQQIFTGNFDNVNGVDLILYGGASFTSGNTDVLTVSPGGLVSAVSPGTTTVVASSGGKSATNTLTVLAIPATLAHRYSFTSDASDSVGGANGMPQGTVAFTGGKLVLDGFSYVDLPANIINIATNQSLTLEAWVDFVETPFWSRLFDFGEEGGANEIYCAPRGPGNGGQHRAISQNFNGGQTIDWQGAWTNQSAHLTWVLDPGSGTLAIYVDGVLEYARHDATAPLSRISTSAATLGRSFVGVDPFMPGSIDEFRIYSGALSAPEIALTHANGPNSTARDPGALVSITVSPATYPAYSGIVPPVILANYANLANFNLLPNNSAVVVGLTLESSDTNVIQVLPNNMLRTLRPGTATLTATLLGKTDSATVTVANVATLVHRYSFTNDASDSVGTAHGSLQGTATVTGGSLLLDGTAGSYLELPPALLEGYDAVTVDAWVTFITSPTWARFWYFGNDRANEFYVAPSVLGGDVHWFSTGFPVGGATITLPPRWEAQTVHLTCIYGNGTMAMYTNGVLHGILNDVQGRTDQIGTWFSWIGRSPYGADAYLNCSVDEFRIYNGSLAPDEIMASDALGASQLPGTTAELTVSQSGGNITLSWPVAAAGFSVQSRSDLVTGNWTTLTNSPVLAGSNWEVTLPAGTGARFFRLWR